MLVLLFGDAVELEIDAVLPGGLGGLAELYVFGIADAVGRRKDSVEADFFGVSDGLQKVGRKRRLSAGEENDDLAARLETYRAI
jgi:hypothetical protein